MDKFNSLNSLESNGTLSHFLHNPNQETNNFDTMLEQAFK